MPRNVAIQVRRGTAAEWTSSNPILYVGEICLETDTHKTKYGDGSTHWNDLPYSTCPVDGNSVPVQVMRDTDVNLTALTDPFLSGQLCYDTTTGALKIGDGNTPWNQLVAISNSTPTSNFINNEVNWLSNYYYCKKIIFKHKYIPTNLFGYPALISITDDSDLGAHALSNGYDLRFTDKNGELLSYEREEFSISDGICNAKIWVNIPTIYSEIDTVIYMFYGYSSASNGESANNVWDSNYEAVWHLKETSTGAVGDFRDSTKNTHNSVNTVNQPTPIFGAIGTGQSFNGSSGYIDFGDISFTLPFTIEAIVSPTENQNYGVICARNGSTSSTGTGFYLRKHPSGYDGFDFGIYDNAGNQNNVISGPYNINDKYQIVVIATHDTISMYINGKLASNHVSINGFSPYTSQNFIVGRNSYTATYYIAAMLDEIRISNTARSESYIQTSYKNIFSPSDFISIGSEISFVSTNIDHYVVFSNPYVPVGTPQQIVIVAKDPYNNTVNFTGSKDLIFTNNYNPHTFSTCRDSNGTNIDFGNTTNIIFNNGIATSVLKLYNTGNNKITVTDGIYSTEDNMLNIASYSTLVPVDINVIIPSVVVSDVEFPITITLADCYGNSTIGADISLSVSRGSLNLTSISSSQFENGYYSGMLTISGITQNSTVQLTITSVGLSTTVDVNIVGFSINDRFCFKYDSLVTSSVYVISHIAESGTSNLYKTTDYNSDAACIQAVLNAAPSNSTIIFREGDYQIDTQVAKSGKNFNLLGERVVNLHINFAGAVPGILLQGTSGLSTTLSATSLAGSNTIQLTSTTGILKGDIIRIYNDDLFCPDPRDYPTLRVGESYIVDNVTGNIVTLETELLRDYTTEKHSSIVSNHPITINVQNINFYGTGVEGNGIGLQLMYCTNSSVSKCKFQYNGQVSLALYASHDIDVYNNIMLDSNFTGIGYGVSVAAACNLIKIYDNKMRNCRHCIASVMSGIYGENRNIFIFNNDLYNDDGKSYVIDSHQVTINYIVFNNTIHLNNYGAFNDGTLYSLFQNNTVYGGTGDKLSRIGVVKRGYVANTTKIITGNTYINCSCIRGAEMGESNEIYIANNSVSGDYRDHLVFIQNIKSNNITIHHNKVSGTFNAVHLYVEDTYSVDINIYGNLIDNCFGGGIYILYDSNSSGTLNIYNNNFKNLSTGSKGYNSIELHGVKNATVCNNDFTDLYGKALYGVYEYSNCDGNAIFSNTSDGLLGGTQLRLGTNQTSSGIKPTPLLKSTTLTVNLGTGSGIYELGSYVEISANSPSETQVFDKWIGDTGYLNNPNTDTTTVVIPEIDIIIEATYKDVDAVPADNYITFSLNAVGTLGETYLSYTGDKTLIFSGDTNCTCQNKNGVDIIFGENTVITFTNGIAKCVFKFEMTGLKTISVSDGEINKTLKINVI